MKTLESIYILLWSWLFILKSNVKFLFRGKMFTLGEVYFHHSTITVFT